MYDYIVVGAGSAGCVLAARLTENHSASVLLIEAGPPDNADEIHIPAAINLLFQSSYDWGFRTVPQDRAAGQSVYWPRGRVIGGSSSINAMIYIRGNKYDYDTWRDEYGCDGWGYNDILPTSSGPNITLVVHRPTTAVPAPSRSSTRSLSQRQRARSSIRRSPPGRSRTQTSTGRAKTASASIRSLRRTADAGRQPTPTCTRPSTGRT